MSVRNVTNREKTLPRFTRSTAAPPKPPALRERITAAIGDVWVIVLSFLAIVFACAWLYDIASRHGCGIQATFIHGTSVLPTFWTCLYFSVVTISTLGYGDYRPTSYSQLVAALEVISGIVLAGILIARLVSRPMDRISRRLLRGQMNGEIQSFRSQVAPLLNAIRGGRSSPAGAQSVWYLHRAVGLGKAIARYWRSEARQPDLTEVMPVRASSRLLGDLILLLECLEAQIRASGQPVGLGERHKIRALADSVLAVAAVLRDRSSDEGIPHLYSKTLGTVEKLRRL